MTTHRDGVVRHRTDLECRACGVVGDDCCAHCEPLRAQPGSQCFVVDSGELRRALAEMEAAEARGFTHCLAVLYVPRGWGGEMLDRRRLAYSDLWVKAHPSNGAMDWGRGTAVHLFHRVIDGRLVRDVGAGDGRRSGEG